MEEMKSRVYALIDELHRLTRIEGEYSLPENLEGWTLIEEGTPSDRLNLAQTHYLPMPIMTDDGVYRYKYENGQIIERTKVEIEADKKTIVLEPTWQERMEAQILWTAITTNSVLE